ncbi:hypothetical protein HN709_03525 [Candidatus Peregrinibacteria bacterium]|jgi:hypothetical protein|nr:hypothetical protein [Candidatus Peregrinibacteria bacterium]MBT7736736.1 hypothetical protein [Candidatus Peregrinibacteria bacterium]
MKKILLAISVAIILILLLLLFRSCEPRQKTEENEFTEEIAETIEETEEKFDYVNAFIEANTDFTCQIIRGELDPTDEEAAKTALSEAYEKQQFPVEDDATLIEIIEAYKTNDEITAIIKSRVKECQ